MRLESGMVVVVRAAFEEAGGPVVLGGTVML